MDMILYYEDPGDTKVLLDECKRIEDAVNQMKRDNERNTAKKSFAALDR